jgi:hypothetical protein
MRFPFLILLASGIACLTGVALASRPKAPVPPTPDDTLARIRTLVGTAACGGDADCHTLGLGARACGGPEAYLAWSSAQTPRAELEALAARYRDERRALDQATGAESTCRFLPDPGAVCRAGACRLGQGDAGV